MDDIMKGVLPNKKIVGGHGGGEDQSVLMGSITTIY